MRSLLKFDLNHLRGDIYGGLTAGVVAIPLALAFGVASGLGPIAGMYGAIIVGFFAALFGGTPTNVSGPTGPMVVVLAGLFASLSGDVGLILTAVMLAGAFQIVFGAVGFGNYIRLVPYPVVSGFMSGIGVIIIILQFDALFGHDAPAGTLSALAYIPTALSDINMAALTVGVVTLAVAYAWPTRWGVYVPGPLAALITGTVLSLFLPVMPILGDIPSGLPSLHLPVFDQSAMMLVIEAAFILAVLGSIDSLLTSLVADNMTRTRHDSNKELIGQGIGNTVAGLFGGIAGAGATMRTVINIRSGGVTRLSGMIHSVVLAAVVLGVGSVASYIPHAALAGVLFKVGMDIVDFSYLKRAHRGPRWDLVLMALVLGLTVFVDLITAVGAGVVLAALAYVKQVAKTQLDELTSRPFTEATPEERAILDRLGKQVTIFEFGGPLSFGAAADVGHHVRERYKNATHSIILDFNRVPFMDVSAARAVETIGCDAAKAKKTIYIVGMAPQVIETLSSLGADCCLPGDAHFATRLEALEAIDGRSQITEAGGRGSSDKPLKPASAVA
ncbi:low affinity sulfate transporter [Luminiphilus syltensis NOR5-1B]|uniref:Low affinity sulfate transporter n=1 Tax=Luminiphilus syltensis NOR5-1B TaxID=565045 RepID=B8KUW0_9GAMM|nr:SulP family inorganic anion transporter [Luminiphilus syltensis]EED34084.1 low affinity sulfate transporter [Luminiphilus syltensis NOR5-1B]